MAKIGLIAGNGKFPLIFAEEAKRQGYSVVAVAHREETDAALETQVDEFNWIYVGQLGKIIRTFHKAGVTEAVMAGGIRKVRLLGNFRPDLRGARFLAKLKKRDDDALLRGIADELASDGIKIIDSTFCLANIIPQEGVLTRRQPNAAQWEDIALGIRVAKEIGRLGIGQTVVVKNQVCWRWKRWRAPMRRSNGAAGWPSPVAWWSRSVSRSKTYASMFQPSASKRSRRCARSTAPCWRSKPAKRY